MSSPERRRQKQLELEEEQRRLEIERQRKDSLTMYQRIEECAVADDLKDILHRLANGEREIGY